jgi:predicted DNA-binding transcriptional regulator AlpA
MLHNFRFTIYCVKTRLIFHRYFPALPGATRVIHSVRPLSVKTSTLAAEGFVSAGTIRIILIAMQTDELLTYEELGELLRLKKTAMAAAKRRGDLPPAIRIGRKNLRWRRQTIQAWLEEQERPVVIDPVFAERSAKAVAARHTKTVTPHAGRRRGRPTKAEQVERRACDAA